MAEIRCLRIRIWRSVTFSADLSIGDNDSLIWHLQWGSKTYCQILNGYYMN